MFNMRKRFVCCTRETKFSLDFDEQDGVVVYSGLDGCILNNQVYDVESRMDRGDGFVTDSLDDNQSSCSSSKDVSESVCSKWFTPSKEEQYLDECELSGSPKHIFVKEKAFYAVEFSEVEGMKEKFVNLLLGEDVTGGCKGVATAVALSNAITNLAASVFGELWKLEPLPEERKNRWQQEMDWLLSPTNYMVELVPATQNSANGILEIMASKPRADIYMNLPALKKLDSILIEILDSMVNTEFWYTEVGSKTEGRDKTVRESKRWWLPSPQVPKSGLSDKERKKLQSHSKVVHQVLKAAKAINESILSDMHVPAVIKDAFSKSGKTSLGDELYKVLSAELDSPDEMFKLLNLKSEHGALEAVNKLEAAALVWKERIIEQGNGNSRARRSLSLGMDMLLETEKSELFLNRAEALLRIIKLRYPNLPQTFLDSTRVKYGKDVGHSILEAYSRVLGNLAFSIHSRIEDILREDIFVNPS